MKKEYLDNKLKKRYYVYLGFNFKILMLSILYSSSNAELRKNNKDDSDVIITAIP